MLRLWFLPLVLCAVIPHTTAQTLRLDTIPIPELLYHPENQFSGLKIMDGRLYLMPECRIQQGHAARLYSVRLSQTDSVINHFPQTLDVATHPIYGLDKIVEKISRYGNSFEGLEAIAMAGSSVFLAVETTTESSHGFLLKGSLMPAGLTLDTSFFLALPKPALPDGSFVFNAGFEAIEFVHKGLAVFFEYNAFAANHVLHVDTSRGVLYSKWFSINPLPFRLTAADRQSKKSWLATSFFFSGDSDSIYRPGATNPDIALVSEGQKFHPYNRLLLLKKRGNTFHWKVLGELPSPWWGLNTEGLATYKEGAFVINDKFTPSKPYRTVLMYIRP